MKLKSVDGYNIGLDLGTGSVGWAVTSTEGELLHFKGKPTWGSRIFPEAKKASEARTNRGQRRRYVRRRWRLNLLQGIFEGEMVELDPEFFIRLNQSRLLREDRAEGHANYRWPIFNGSDFTEPAYYEKFPTIYHLRAWLMTTPEKVDLRLIYLAFHNIVKTRGNFLHQDNPSLSAANANMGKTIEKLAGALEEWCTECEISCAVCVDELQACLEDAATSRGAKRDCAKKLFGFSKEHEKMGKELASAIVGFSTQFTNIFIEEYKDSKFSLSNDEKAEAYCEQLPDEAQALFRAIQGVYSAYVLSGILKSFGNEPINSAALQGVVGNTISFAKVREYERYKEDLRLLKTLVRAYAPGSYDDFFRGSYYEDERKGSRKRTRIYDPAKAKGYTAYNLKKLSYDDFRKQVTRIFENVEIDADKKIGDGWSNSDKKKYPSLVGLTHVDAYRRMMAAFAEERFLRRLKTSDNGSIPYQLHLEEMHAIIENQGQHYPFLLAEREKIESLVHFRIPYYVGPLTQKNAALDAHDEARFAWAKRLPGKEKVPVYPWNWEEVINKNDAAESFIHRMTSDCTYLLGEPVLPKCSLLYEEFCVLNELNGSRCSVGDGEFHRFDYADRAGIVESLFKKSKSVTYKKVEEWLRCERGHESAHVKGGQGEYKYESKLSSYIFFCKDVFHVDELDRADYPMVEEIILWNTLFEDRSILKERIEHEYGDRLSAEQIKAICKKRFTGWGKLSEKLLTGICANAEDDPICIMDVLREGNPNGSHVGGAMVFMEVLHDDKLGFEKLIERENKEQLAGAGKMSVQDLPGSPALRRTVSQAVRIVEEIAHVAGKPPANIFIENTREDDDPKKKGMRTTKRYDKIKEAVGRFKAENAELEENLKGFKAPDFSSERLVLYFMQGGKSLYSGKTIDINRLSGSEYQVDHIIPQSYIKDDSFENKALVLSGENQAKGDNLLISKEVRTKMAGYWKALHDAGLIGDKKFKNLTCSSISERRMKGFVARQLVETSQIIKLTQMMLEGRLPQTRILPIRASISHELREVLGLVKCREINDFHHAHDALLAAQVGRFILVRHAAMYDNPIGYTHVMRDYVRAQARAAKRTGRMPGSAGHIVSSFLRSGFDKETGEIFGEDTWDADFECARLRKYFDCKQVFISRMPEETSGAFWDATIYSPRDTKKKLALPLKQGLDPKKYGGFSREQFAYFFIYEVRNKKGKPAMALAGVPVRIVAAVERDSGVLKRYATELANAEGNDFVCVAREKVYKYQQIELDGNRLFITGLCEARNCRQLAFTQCETAAVAKLVEGSCDADAIAAVFDALAERLPVHAPWLASRIGINDMRERFAQAAAEDQRKLLLGIIAVAAAKANVVDTRAVGGSQFAGRILPTYSKLLASSDGIVFIDQSVTGMFERRTRIGL